MEPICGLATPPGRSAIAVLRLSGENCIELFSKIFQSSNSLRDLPRRSLLGKITYREEIIDEVLAVSFPAPNSFTGEDMVEVYPHGNPVIIEKILKALYKAGFEPAMGGDFTKRAVLNGKMDLTQAEGIRDIIEARSERELQQAQRMKEGGFRKELLQFKSSLLNFAADLTAELDFSDEDIQFQDTGQKLQFLTNLQSEIRELIEDSRQMQILRKGFEAVILGPPNAGKSSLLNRLIGKDRALVSDTPGTTRDYLESGLQIGGMEVKIVDTAGIRKTGADTTENMGILRSKDKYKDADLCLLVLDASVAPSNQDLEEFGHFMNIENPPPIVLVLNKWDIVEDTWEKTQSEKQLIEALQEAKISAAMAGIIGKNAVRISALHDLHIRNLKQSLEKILSEKMPHGSGLLLSQWQSELLEKITEELDLCSQAIQAEEYAEIAASYVQNALDYISQLTGEITNEDLLGRIFSRFCIGK